MTERCPHCGAQMFSDIAAIKELSFADLTLYVDTHILARNENAITLSRLETATMEMFMEHPGQVLTATQIYNRVWGYDFGPDSNRLTVMISTLRRKLGEPIVVHTVRGVGYVLRVAQ